MNFFGNLKFALCGVGCFLFAAFVSAADMAETFENAADQADVTTVNNWYGYGSVSGTGTYAAPEPAGFPIEGSHTKTVAVDGFVVCTNQTVSGEPANVDMMVQVVYPTEALAIPEEEDLSTIQLAIGIQTNGALCIYHTPKNGGSAVWTESSKKYASNTWIRVSFIFDYAAKRCQVRQNGEPLLTAGGFVTSNATDTAESGSWYGLVNNEARQLTSLKVIGSTSLDDVVVKSGVYVFPFNPNADPAEKVVDGVSKEWLADNGLEWTDDVTTSKLDDSGLTVAQKYVTGLDPRDNSKFEMKTMSFDKLEDKDVVEIVFPGTPAEGYEFRIQTKTSANGSWAPAEVKETAVKDGRNHWKVSFTGTDANVLYYQVKAVKK